MVKKTPLTIEPLGAIKMPLDTPALGSSEINSCYAVYYLSCIQSTTAVAKWYIKNSSCWLKIASLLCRL